MRYDELAEHHGTHGETLSRVLTRYRDFRPTTLDTYGAFLRDRHDWYVAPVTHTYKVASIAETSNWETMLAALRESKCSGWEQHRFGHWATNFDMVLVRPRSLAWKVAVGCALALDQYPYLDEDDVTEREHESACDNFYAGDVANLLSPSRFPDDEGAARINCWLRHNVTLDMALRHLEHENDEGYFRWRFETDYRSNKRVRADKAELYAKFRKDLGR